MIYILAIKNPAQALRHKVFLIKTQTKATSRSPTIWLRSEVLWYIRIIVNCYDLKNQYTGKRINWFQLVKPMKTFKKTAQPRTPTPGSSRNWSWLGVYHRLLRFLIMNLLPWSNEVIYLALCRSSLDQSSSVVLPFPQPLALCVTWYKGCASRSNLTF